MYLFPGIGQAVGDSFKGASKGLWDLFNSATHGIIDGCNEADDGCPPGAVLGWIGDILKTGAFVALGIGGVWIVYEVYESVSSN